MLTKITKIDYDANNKQHRQLYYSFVKKHSWHTTPPFQLKPPHTNLPQQLQHETVEYYLNHEFENHGH
jgi:hypothetical protein